MNEAPKKEEKTQRGLSEKQIDFAINVRKPMFVENAKELVNFLEQQNDTKWWLDRRKFDWCVSTFVKMKADQWYEQHPEQRPQQNAEQNQDFAPENNPGLQEVTPAKSSFSEPPAEQVVVSNSGMKI